MDFLQKCFTLFCWRNIQVDDDYYTEIIDHNNTLRESFVDNIHPIEGEKITYHDDEP